MQSVFFQVDAESSFFQNLTPSRFHDGKPAVVISAALTKPYRLSGFPVLDYRGKAFGMVIEIARDCAPDVQGISVTLLCHTADGKETEIINYMQQSGMQYTISGIFPDQVIESLTLCFYSETQELSNLLVKSLLFYEMEKFNGTEQYLDGSLQDDRILFEPAEPMQFRFVLRDKEGLPVEHPYYLHLQRYGDDGIQDFQIIPPGQECMLTTSSTCYGSVTVRGLFCDKNGVQIPNSPHAFISALIHPERLIQGVSEADDFDEFWQSQKYKAAQVPVTVEKMELLKKIENSLVYDVKITSWGGKPASGILVIPENAREKSCPAIIEFMGYCIAGASIPSEERLRGELKDTIFFNVNAHGIDNLKDQAYYDSLNLQGYALFHNEKPETSYFLGMFHRAMRAVKFVQTLPQWNGKLKTFGSSQGGLQAIAAAALSEDVSQCSILVPWCCDLGGPIAKNRVTGWRPEWQPGLVYFDTVNLVKRLKCPIEILGGMGDSCCPPSGISILFNNAPGEKKLTLVQGGEHCSIPPRAVYYQFHGNWQEIFPEYELSQSNFSGLYGANDSGIFHIKAKANCVDSRKKICCRLIKNGTEEIYKQIFAADQVPDIPFSFRGAGEWLVLELTVIDEHGVTVSHKKSQHIGAISVPHILQYSTPENPDFDRFWQEQKNVLAQVPVKSETVSEKIKDGFKISDIRIDCATPLPVSGILCIPEKAKPASLPAIISYHGAGVRSACADPMDNAIRLDINAHGIENSREAEYYKEMAEQINKARRIRVRMVYFWGSCKSRIT